MWSNLLGTALLPEFKDSPAPDFHKLLAQLSPAEGKLLDDLYRKEIDQSHIEREDKLAHLASYVGIPKENCKVLLTHLWSLDLVHGPDLQNAAVMTWGAPGDYEVSELGKALMKRCTFLSPKSK
jgi:hypothetical protein